MNKRHIIEEAMKLFMLQGVKNTTMDDIAKHLGMSKRTIYENFRDKNELLSEGMDQMHNKHVQEIEQLLSETENVLEVLLLDLKQKKEQYHTRKLKVMIEMKRYYSAIYQEHFRKSEDEKMKRLSELFETGIKQGVFREGINPKTSAFLFSEQARLLFTEQLDKWDVEAQKFDFSCIQIFEDLFMNFLRGISTPKGLEIIERSK